MTETRKATRTIFLAPNGGSPEPDHPELVMNEGRMFATTNDDIIVTDGPFFRLLLNPTLIWLVLYQKIILLVNTQLNKYQNNKIHFLVVKDLLFSDEEQTIIVEPNGTQRIFTYTYFPESFASEITITLDLICGEVFVSSSQVSGTLGCGDGPVGQATPDIPSAYNIENDTELIVEILDLNQMEVVILVITQ